MKEGEATVVLVIEYVVVIQEQLDKFKRGDLGRIIVTD